MGINVQSCCHKCQVRVFHYRGEECLTMMPFYYKHRPCLAINSANLETKEDQNQEEEWMSEYPYDEEIQVIARMGRCRKYYCKKIKRNEADSQD